MLNMLRTRMGRISHLKTRRNFPPTLKKQNLKYFLFSRRDIHGHKVHSKYIRENSSECFTSTRTCAGLLELGSVLYSDSFGVLYRYSSFGRKVEGVVKKV